MTNQITKRALLTNGGLSAGLGASTLAVLAQRASADTSFTRFAFPATGAPTLRTMPDRLAEIINVKDFGAVGDGVTDDTSAIQAALDAAFGPPSNFHNWQNAHLNKEVHFPAGKYRVVAPQAPRAITNITNDFALGNGQGHLTYTTSGNHGFKVGQLVWVSGADCNGDGNRLVKIGSIPASNQFTTLTQPLMTHYTGGGRVQSIALSVTGVFGGKISGAGAFSSELISATSGGIVFATNGWKHGVVKDLGFIGQGARDSGTGFHLDLDNDGPATLNIQGISFDSFYDCLFSGFAGGIGCNVGPTNRSQADTIFFNNCIFMGNEVGCRLGQNWNMNCINVSFFGGNFMTNGWGILSDFASPGAVVGALFEQSAYWDIETWGGGQQELYLAGITTESTNFCHVNIGQPYVVSTNQRSGANGTFLQCPYGGVIENCYSRFGQVLMQSGGAVRDSQFLRSDAFINDANYLKPVLIERCMIGATSWDEGALGSWLPEPNYIRGIMINSAVGGRQYFIGEKHSCTSTGRQGKTFHAMRVGDLPPATQAYTQGVVVTVHDCHFSGPWGRALNLATDGGGTNIVVVYNDGINWRILGGH
jgi:hypothetical protein